MTTPGSLETEVPECCGEPKRWRVDSRRRSGGNWRCRVEKREIDRRYLERQSDADRERRRAYQREAKRQRYEAMSGLEYNRLLLTHRRHKALSRRRERQEAQVG